MERLCFVALMALVLDYLIGDPDWLWRKIPHPVAVFGAAIKFFDRQFNRQSICQPYRKIYGCLAILALLSLAFIVAFYVHILFLKLNFFGIVLEAFVASIFIAQKSLVDHVHNVAKAFQLHSLQQARKAVSMIVGRETENLDEGAVSRAAIESLAENSSDGVVAPVLWYLVLGLPGLVCYKMLNTADSMIGYKNARFKDFGWASARLDDIANFIPARLTALIIIIALYVFSGKSSAKEAFKVVARDARCHHSPNAGFPECAFAGGLGIRLLGPRIYDGTLVEEPFQNSDGKAALPADIDRAIKLFNQSMTVLSMMILVLLIVAVCV